MLFSSESQVHKAYVTNIVNIELTALAQTLSVFICVIYFVFQSLGYWIS